MYTGLQNILAMRWSLENSYKVQKSRITVQPAVFPSTPRALLFLSRLMSVQPGPGLSSLNPNSNSSASISSTYFASCIYVILFDRRRFIALTFPSLRCHNKNNSYRARSILTHTTTCRMYVCVHPNLEYLMPNQECRTQPPTQCTSPIHISISIHNKQTQFQNPFVL